MRLPTEGADGAQASVLVPSCATLNACLASAPMRNILISLSVASILVLVGCDERESMKVTQDRQGHAYVAEGTGSGLPQTPVAAPGEQYITTGPKDTLTSVSKKYNTTLSWLIKRNHLDNAEKYKDGVPPGTNLIVPDPNAKR